MLTNDNKKAVIFGLISFFCFAIADSINRYILYYDLMSFPIYFTYVKAGTLFWMLLIGVSLHKKSFFYVENKKVTLIRSIVRTVNTIGATLSVAFLPLDIFYSIVFIMPLLSVLGGILFLKEKFSMVKIFIILLGFAGVFIIIKPIIADDLKLIGIIITLITAVTGAASGLIARKYLQNENPWGSTFYSLILATIAGIMMSISTLEITAFHIPSLSSFILIAITSITTSIAGVFYMKAYQIGWASFVAPTQYTQLFWGSLIGIIIFHDIPSLNTLVGCAVIIAASLLNYKNFTKHPKIN